jgi:hypothetical protein
MVQKDRTGLRLTDGASGFLLGVPLGCLRMGTITSEAPALPKLLLSKGRGCVRPVSREQPHAPIQRRQQRHVPSCGSWAIWQGKAPALPVTLPKGRGRVRRRLSSPTLG